MNHESKIAFLRSLTIVHDEIVCTALMDQLVVLNLIHLLIDVVLIEILPRHSANQTRSRYAANDFERKTRTSCRRAIATLCKQPERTMDSRRLLPERAALSSSSALSCFLGCSDLRDRSVIATDQAYGRQLRWYNKTSPTSQFELGAKIEQSPSPCLW